MARGKNKDVIENARELRIRAKLSMKEVVNLSNLSRGTVSKIENGQAVESATLLRYLAFLESHCNKIQPYAQSILEIQAQQSSSIVLARNIRDITKRLSPKAPSKSNRKANIAAVIDTLEQFASGAGLDGLDEGQQRLIRNVLERALKAIDRPDNP